MIDGVRQPMAREGRGTPRPPPPCRAVERTREPGDAVIDNRLLQPRGGKGRRPVFSW